MTRKHFEAVAAAIRETKRDRLACQTDNTDVAIGGVVALLHLQTKLAEYFASINPNFNREKFAAACDESYGKKISN